MTFIEQLNTSYNYVVDNASSVKINYKEID